MRMRGIHSLLASALVALGGLAGILSTGQAHAAYATCRTDPVITLSTGKQVTLWAVTQTSAANIAAVYYTLHIPAGTTVNSVQGDQYGALEHITVVADSQGNQIRDYTEVMLMKGKATVSVYMADNTGNDTATVTGTTGKWLEVG